MTKKKNSVPRRVPKPGVKIVCNTGDSNMTKVFLPNGTELSGIMAIDIYMRPNKPNVAHMQVLLNQLDVIVDESDCNVHVHEPTKEEVAE